MKKRASANPNLQLDCNGGIQTSKISLYEQSREERIKENLQRMQKLGIMDLSHKLNSLLPDKLTRKKNPSSTSYSCPLPPPGPVRRSSRLQNAAPVSYAEVGLAKKDEGVKLEVGTRPEVYTEEHEKLLGNTERSWTLFVDGYGKDGNRIYDPAKGKTCHQCRQKTLGHRTHCCKCNMVQGQFCGDCLYMRYGEHVLEAIENPNWVCPVCRGICNCSLCRNAKGWAPTGALYKKISQMGFKSVAHYLIQTRQAQTNIEKNPENRDPVSAKRSLSFPDAEAHPEEPYRDDSNHLGISKAQSEERDHDGFNSEKENNPAAIHQISVKESNLEQESKDAESEEIDLKANGHLGITELDFEDKKNAGFKVEHGESHLSLKEHDSSNMVLEPRFDGKYDFQSDEVTGMTVKGLDTIQAINNTFLLEEKKEVKEVLHSYNKNGKRIVRSGSDSKLKKRSLAAEPTVDSIAGRLRQRCKEVKDHNVQALNIMLSENELEKGELVHGDNQHGESSIGTENSIGGRLRQRRKEGKDHNEQLSENESEKEKQMLQGDSQHGESNIGTESSSKLKKRLTVASVPSADSIAGRLRQRRREGTDNDMKALLGMNKNTSDYKAVNHTSLGKEAGGNLKHTSSGTNLDSIVKRLRPRNRTM
ncbi:hypothetical protein SLEP1_g8108 [Rubroshorea leprosula]|uniref:Zinc-finger domain-containing protein n=1 Tax=Rubroshorea leprosula TaxID=152421 RepID=A0AAV5I9N8_9ROSI|nr:hypothetical protein SLEP1_g8108 [Rubroshorea leprosula]